MRGKKSRPKAKSCTFCEIVAGRAASFPVLADALAVAFLDYRPLALGHVLLVSRGHFETLADVPEDVMAGLALRAQRLSAAVMNAMGSQGSFLALNNIVSQSVPHVHFHIVPRRRDDKLFSSGLIWKRVAYKDDAERAEVTARIKTALG